MFSDEKKVRLFYSRLMVPITISSTHVLTLPRACAATLGFSHAAAATVLGLNSTSAPGPKDGVGEPELRVVAAQGSQRVVGWCVELSKLFLEELGLLHLHDRCFTA